MSSKESTWRRLLRAFRTPPPKPYRLEELVSVKRKGKTEAQERLEVSETLMKRCELLYRLEPLIFSGVNKLTRRITGTRIFFSGPDDTENQKAQEFLQSSGLESLLPHLVKDAFIYGFGVAEIVKKGRNIVFNQIYPVNFDYQREGTDIKLVNGRIAGFVYRKKGVEDITLKPEEVLLIRFYSLGEFNLGISPIEPAFKAAWIKLNLEEALGEAVFRHGYPLYVFRIGDREAGPWREITPEKIKQAKSIIGDVNAATEMVLPWWIEIDSVKGGDVANVQGFLEFLSMEILAAVEMPKAFGIQTRGLGGRAVEEMDFEKTILAMQQELKRQLMEQVMIPYYKSQRFKTQPQMNFVEYAPELQNARLRRLSAYAKHGLLTRTDSLENELRKREGFPLKEKRKTEDLTKCLFGLGTCPIREEEDIPLDKLAAFCNICTLRSTAERQIKELDKRSKESSK